MNCIDLMIASCAISFGWLIGKSFYSFIVSSPEEFKFPRFVHFLLVVVCLLFLVLCFYGTVITF